MNTQILEQIRQLKREIMPNERLILFGSQARGDARPDSDWDLLALVDKNESSIVKNYDEYGYPFDELGWDFGVCINTVIVTKKDWESRPSLLKLNVMREGVEIS